MKDLISIFQAVKSDFCNFTDYKLRGETLEIITSISTVNQSFVSVFVSIQQADTEYYIVSDGGWLDADEYEVEEYENGDLTTIIDQQLIERYGVKTTNTRKGLYYYKPTNDFTLISSLVFDVANFIAAYVNYRTLLIKNLNESRKRKPQFQARINKFLKAKYQGHELAINERVKVDDNHSLRFNSVIRPTVVRQRTTVIMYVNGSKPDDYNDSIARATSHFDIINKYAINKGFFEKLAIMNVDASGYEPNQSLLFTRNLTEALGREPLRIHEDSSLQELNEFLPSSNLFDF